MTRATVAVAAALLGVTGVTAAAVRVAGLDEDARGFLRFTFAGTDASALQLAMHNARIAGASLLAAAAVPQLKRSRVVVDVVIGSVLVGNAVAVGVALGAYGSRAATAVALHGPLELAALSLGGGALITAHRRRLPAAVLTRVGAACAALLVTAGALEASVQIGGPR